MTRRYLTIFDRNNTISYIKSKYCRKKKPLDRYIHAPRQIKLKWDKPNLMGEH